jgi:membrane AbrB-like protein
MSQPSLDEIPAQTSAVQSPPASGVSSLARTGAILIATFAVGLAGGHVAKLLNFPLPYMTGSLLVTAALGLSGVPVRSLWQVRAAGQFVTGAAVGTAFTPQILVTVVTLLPVMILGTAISVGIAAIGALMLLRIADLDPKTAMLAAMPGGVIEMANVAHRVGADTLPTLVLQTMRVGLTVCAAPFVVNWLAEPGARNVVTQVQEMSWLAMGALMAASFLGGLFLNRFALPNSWFLGSLFVMAALGALGLIPGRVPGPILIVAQVVIGVSIGTQYKHEFLTRLLRLFLSSLVTVPFALTMLALLAAVFSVLLGLPVSTLVLALAPAGIAEMALTGKVLGLDAALITAFQIMRIVLVLSVAAPTCRLFERLVSRRRSDG